MPAGKASSTVGVFGPSDDRLYGPWGEATRVVRGPRTFEQLKVVDPGLNQPVCHMLDLPVEAVVDAALKLIQQTEPEAPPAPFAAEPLPEPLPEALAEPAAADAASETPKPAPKPRARRAPRARKEDHG